MPEFSNLLYAHFNRKMATGRQSLLILLVVVSFFLFPVSIFARQSQNSFSAKAGNDTSSLSADSMRADQTRFEKLKILQNTNPATIDHIADATSGNMQMNKLVKSIINRELSQSKQAYLQHKETLEQSRSFVKIYSECEQANILLKEGFNYKLANDQIRLFSEWKDKSVDGILVNRDKVQSIRNLTTTSILLNEILGKTETSLQGVKQFNEELAGYQFRLDSLVKNSKVYLLPSDSAQIKSYMQKLLLMKTNLDPVNESLRIALDSIQRIEIQFDILRLHIQSDIAATEQIRKNLFKDIEMNELARVDAVELQKNTFEKNISHAMTKGILVLVFYYSNHSGKFLIMLCAFVFILLYLNLLKKRTAGLQLLEKINAQTRVLRNPVSSAVILTLTFFQFVLPEPPFVISAFFWTLSIVAFSFFLSHFVEKKWYIVWLIFIVLFLMMCFVNTLLRYSDTERTLIYFLSVSSFLLGGLLIYNVWKSNIVDKVILLPLVIMNVLELISIYFNIVGSYNFSKMYMVNGIMIFVLSYLLLWCIRLVNETLNISIYFQKSMNDEAYDLPAAVFAKKMPFTLYFAMLLASVYLIYRTSFTYQSLIDPLYESFTETHKIGEFTFTFQSIFIFFLVMYISTLISKIVTFLTIGVETVAMKGNGKKGVGSWMLMIRIGIISIGTVLAFVAAGIPVDRLAILISAMGVGVVFGLQTLINNLVSGLFIAIEKPINVGDFVEIAGKSGKMKSIGIRSSMITTFDGADVIIPNGDLMNQHLINWTLGNNRKRFEMSVGVAYNSDLEMVQNLILNMLSKDKRIMKNPEPLLFFTKFNDSSIDFEIKFWVYHYDDGKQVLSDLIIDIDKAFKENGIEIPFPQHELHIKKDEKEVLGNSAETEKSEAKASRRRHPRQETFEGGDDD